MGYHTKFKGSFKLNRPLEPLHHEYLERFAETRRMKRGFGSGHVPGLHNDVGLPVGFEGEFFVGGTGYRGQNHDIGVTDYNHPPSDQPGLWCQWVPSKDGTAIVWDGGEKFYDYVEWLEYLMGNFLVPWGYTLHGTVKWQGEDGNDAGLISVDGTAIRVTR